MFELLDGRASAFQWDTGLYIDCTGLKETDQVHFCRPGQVLAIHPAMQGETLAAPVPDELLQQAQPIIVYAYAQTVTGEITRVAARLCVIARPKPPGYIASPTEALRWGDLQEQIDKLSEEIGNGLSENARTLLITVLRNGVYSTDQSANITALEAALASSGGGSGDGDSGETVTYTIANALSNVTTNNTAASVTANSAYTATLTASDGYTLNTVTVIMGGVDVTDSVYANGVISIASVTGDVVITASAVETVSGGDTITIGGKLYDISSASEYEYKMVISTGSGYFLYAANQPFYINIRSDGTTYNEVYPSGTVRGKENNNAFPELTAYGTSDGYTVSSTPRTAASFVYTSHDLTQRNETDVVIPAS